MQRGRPGAKVVAVAAVGLIALAARVPLSGYTISDAKQDSPFLLAVFRLEKAVGIGSGSLVVAIAASILAGLAVAACFRPVFVRFAVLATLVEPAPRRSEPSPSTATSSARCVRRWSPRTRAGSTTPACAT